MGELEMAKAKIVTAKEVELNRWCIEMALRWPVVSVGGYGAAAGQLGYQNLPRSDQDADVIGRAAKIMAWVNASHSA